MNMQKIVRTLVFLCLLAGSWLGSYAQSDFQPMAGGVKPLYTTSMSEYKKFVRLSYDYSPQLYRVTGQASACRPATSIASPNYTVRAWRGTLSEMGATAPVSVSVTPVMRRANEDYGPDVPPPNIDTDGDGIPDVSDDPPTPPVPLGDTPWWLVAVLLLGYCCYRRKVYKHRNHKNIVIANADSCICDQNT